MADVLKIVLSGPESTGKSVTAQFLARQFNLTYVPEFAREFLEVNGPEYDFQLVCKMARRHYQIQQEQIHETEGIIILDTDLINYLVWQKTVFKQVDPWLINTLESQSDHRYLICKPDIPWEPDPLRENPSNRQSLFEQHLLEIKSRGRRYKVLSGHYDVRLTNATKLFTELTRKD